jgi:hypothetical protein
MLHPGGCFLDHRCAQQAVAKAVAVLVPPKGGSEVSQEGHQVSIAMCPSSLFQHFRSLEEKAHPFVHAFGRQGADERP